MLHHGYQAGAAALIVMLGLAAGASAEDGDWDPDLAPPPALNGENEPPPALNGESGASAEDGDWNLDLAPPPALNSENEPVPEIELPPDRKKSWFRPIPRLSNPGFVSEFQRGETSIKLRVQQKRAGIKFTLPIRRKK
ncbi:MAG: hypothetical protein C0605_08350 [Hyphomicrobiales bacterium]|nr:MAG: hypothetical protein C0605_08350 [Hyphomicrobiales bacterium]